MFIKQITTFILIAIFTNLPAMAWKHVNDEENQAISILQHTHYFQNYAAEMKKQNREIRYGYGEAPNCNSDYDHSYEIRVYSIPIGAKQNSRGSYDDSKSGGKFVVDVEHKAVWTFDKWVKTCYRE